MSALSFLGGKSWHTGSAKNRQAVKNAVLAKEEAKRKQEVLRKQRAKELELEKQYGYVPKKRKRNGNIDDYDDNPDPWEVRFMYQQPELAADKEAREKRERGEEDEVDENGNPKPKEYEGIPDIPENRKVIDYLKSRPKTGVHVALAPEIITSKCFRCGHYGHRTGPMFMQGNPKNEEFNHRHLDPMASYLSKKKQKAPASSTDISVVSKSSSGLSALDYRSILDESSNSSSSSSSESSSEERKRRKRKRRRRKEKRDRSRRSHSRKKSRSRRSRSRSHSRSRSPSPRSSHHRHRPGLLEDEGDREGRGREGNSSRRRSSPPSRKRSRSRSTERSHRKRTEGGDYKRRRRR